MVAPRNEFAFDESQARAATERWLRRTPIREAGSHALSQGRFDSVELKDRLAKRVNRLLGQIPAQAALPDRTAMPGACRISPGCGCRPTRWTIPSSNG